MTFDKKWLILFMALMVLVISASADTQITTTTPTHSSETYYSCVHIIKPIGDRMVGDTFTISGTTDLPVDQEISYMIQMADLGPGSPRTRPPSLVGVVIVKEFMGHHAWSIVVNTSEFRKDTGVQAAASYGDYNLFLGPPSCEQIHQFTLHEKPAKTTPAQPASVSPTIVILCLGLTGILWISGKRKDIP